MKQFDVAVIGSGPSGAAAAFKLAENGISTVILEKETLPRYKTCGGGFSFRGRKMLPFEITSAIEKEFYSVDFFFSGHNIHLNSTRDIPIVTMVMRDTFDELIVNKAKELGVTVLENYKLSDINFNHGINLISSEGDKIKVKYVIAADGALSPTAKLAGWENDTRKLIPALEYEVEVGADDFERLSSVTRFDIDFIPSGYAWSFPKKNHLSIGVATTKRNKINLKEYYSDYLTELGIKNIISETAHGFQIPISPRKDGFVKNNVFLTGDAAGFADPLTAEGISNAIYSGYLAAESIIESKLDIQPAENIYMNKLNEKLIPELETGLLIAKLFYEQPTIRNFFLKKYGNRCCEYIIDIFVGDRFYPKDIKQVIKNKLGIFKVPI